jgi:RimJ/RimL family protein N-acetyltransferase
VLTFHPSTDWNLIQGILTDPRLYSFMANDGAPPREDFSAGEGQYMAVLCCNEAGKLTGVFLIVPVDIGSAEIHFCFAPGSAWRMKEAGREFVQWVWRETSLDRLIGPCPSYNPLALRTAKAAGFREAGKIRAKQTKNGKPFHLILTAIERPQ